MHWTEHAHTFHLTLGGPADRDSPRLESFLARVMEVATTRRVALLVTFSHSELSAEGLRLGLALLRAVGPNLAAVAVVTRALKVRVTCSWLAMAIHPVVPALKLNVFDDEAAAAAWLEAHMAHVPLPGATPSRRAEV